MIIPIVDIKEFEKIGFKKCKKPYDKCYYLCFARGVQYIFLSPVMLDINKWEDNDPRIHKKPNCRYRDRRTALEIIVEMAKNNMITCDYLEGNKYDYRNKFNRFRENHT